MKAPDPHYTAYLKEFGPEDTDQPASDFWFGFLFGFGSCLAPSCLAIAWVVG